MIHREEDHVYAALLLLTARISGDQQTMEQIRLEHSAENLLDGLLEVGAALAPPSWGGTGAETETREPTFDGSEPGA